jgi:hypothetical protein
VTENPGAVPRDAAPGARKEPFGVALEVEAINPVRSSWLPANLGIIARWEVTCGLCRTRFSRVLPELMIGSRMSWVGCPQCGTHNLLPHHPALRGRGG